MDILRGGILKLDVSKIFNSTDEYFFEGKLNKDEFYIENVSILEDVSVVLDMREIAGEIFIKGKLGVRLSLQCVKCLENFEEYISEEFEVIYMSRSSYEEYEESYKAEHEYSYKEVIREKLENNFIDITKLIQEYIIVAMPEFPKCSSDCEGLKENSQYENNDIDPRWQQLLNIVKEK